ncbi:hypothetical protein [Pelagibacterium mangrovi]|uniref:hypothetical protein n=1 Tax=Pelagibacterium mangrovi TaxID=3119828 RepID=UPI002FC7D7FE
MRNHYPFCEVREALRDSLFYQSVHGRGLLVQLCATIALSDLDPRMLGLVDLFAGNSAAAWRYRQNLRRWQTKRLLTGGAA